MSRRGGGRGSRGRGRPRCSDRSPGPGRSWSSSFRLTKTGYEKLVETLSREYATMARAFPEFDYDLVSRALRPLSSESVMVIGLGMLGDYLAIGTRLGIDAVSARRRFVREIRQLVSAVGALR